MPTYVYRRPDGSTFEVTQRISDDALKVDPDTGEPVERVIGGGAGLIFKGTGFYLTDYARKSGNDPSKEKSAGASAESTSESKSSESKSDTSSTKSESPSKSSSD